MNKSRFFLFALIIISSFAFVAAANASIFYENDFFYNSAHQPLSNVSGLLYSCGQDSSCSLLNDSFAPIFSQNSGSTNFLQVQYPTTPNLQWYAEYFFKQCYIPKQFIMWAYGTGTNNYDVILDKKSSCQANIVDFSLQNQTLYEGQQVSFYGTIHSAFELTGLGPAYFPSAYHNDFYSADTQILFEIINETNNVIYSAVTAPDSAYIFAGVDKGAGYLWTPTTAGNYTARLTTNVPDCKCLASVQQQRTINFVVEPQTPPPPNQPPVAVLIANQTAGYAPLSVQFDGSSSYDPDGIITSYFWNFGDGSTASTVNPAHIFTSAGDYTVSLTVMDNSSAINAAYVTIFVQQQPAENQLPVVIISADPVQGTAPLTVQFDTGSSYDPDGYITLYQLSFGDGIVAVSSSPIQTNHTYTASGLYNVSLTVYDNASASSSSSILINVSSPPVPNQPPVAIFNYTNSGLPFLSMYFDASPSYDTDGQIVSYLWDFGDGTTSTQINLTHIFPISGNYIVTLNVTDEIGAPDSTFAYIFLDGVPAVAIDVPAIASPGSLMQVFVNATDDFDVEMLYLYDANFNLISSYNCTGLQTYCEAYFDVLVPTAPCTRYTYHAAAVDGNYQYDYDTGSGTTSNSAPIISINANPTSGYAPLSVNFAANVNDDGPISDLTYSWNFGDGTTNNSAALTHTFSNSGTFVTTLTLTDGCGALTSTNTTINVAEPITGFNVDSIACFPNVVVDGKQSCTVSVSALGSCSTDNVKVTIRDYDTEKEQAACYTDALTGSCNAVYGVGSAPGAFAVYATAEKQGCGGDHDKSPIYTYTVLNKRYTITNLKIYNDLAFSQEDYDFYRNETIYVIFDVLEQSTLQLMPGMITQASLVSPPGGMIDLIKMSESGGTYYYYLKIPPTHDFLGNSHVFTFVFNFTDNTAGMETVALTIKNNNPVIAGLPSQIIVDENTTTTISLLQYGYDVEDNGLLLWNITYGESLISAIMSGASTLEITSFLNHIGTALITLFVYDLDNAFASQSVNITVSADSGVHAPVITSTPVTSMTVEDPDEFDTEYKYDVEAYDPDNDALHYYLEAYPVGMAIDSVTGLISWVPGRAQLGQHAITVVVSDGTYSDRQTFTLSVLLPGEDTRPRRKLFVKHFNIINDNCITLNGQVEVLVTVENTGFYDMKSASIILSSPDLQMRKKLGPFKLESEKKITKIMYLDVPENAAPGVYTLRLFVGDDNYARILHREFVIKNRCGS